MFTETIDVRISPDDCTGDARLMTPFDGTDPERRRPSGQTPRCSLCEEAALPQYGGFCFRHMGTSVNSGQARRVVTARRG